MHGRASQPSLTGRRLGHVAVEVLLEPGECITDRAIVDALAKAGSDHPDNGGDERARGAVFPAIPPGIAHVLDPGLVEVGQLVLFRLGGEAEFVDGVDDLPEIVAALDAVLYFAEDFPDLVFDGVRPRGLLLEPVEVGEEPGIDELDEVVAAERGVMVNFAGRILRRSPRGPMVGLVENVRVFPPLQRGLRGLVVLQSVEVIQEEQPRGLLRVVRSLVHPASFQRTSSMF